MDTKNTSAPVDPLASQAAALEAGAFPGAPVVPVVPGIDKAARAAPLAAMLNAFAGAIGSALPFVPKHFNEAANGAIASAFVDLAIEYGWDLSVIEGRAGMWVALVAAGGMPGYACYMDYRAMMETRPKAAAAPDPAPSRDVVMPVTPS